MCTSLKVTPHPRGHIASCNGRVETIEAWVEPVDVLSCPTCASHRAAQVQRLAQQERERKLAKLAKFRKDVKKRVYKVQNTMEQKTCAETTVNSPRGTARDLNHTVSLIHYVVGTGLFNYTLALTKNAVFIRDAYTEPRG